MNHKPKVAKLDGMAKLPHPTVPKEAYIESLITEKKFLPNQTVGSVSIVD